MVFLLIVPDLARYNKQNHHYNMKSARVPSNTQVRHGPQVISQVLNTLDGDGKKMHQWFHLKPLTWVFLLKPLYLSIVLNQVLLLKNIFNEYKFLGHGELLSYRSILFTLQTCAKKEQIINLNALIPSQEFYFPKHLLTSFVCFSTKIYKQYQTIIFRNWRKIRYVYLNQFTNFDFSNFFWPKFFDLRNLKSSKFTIVGDSR